MKTTSKLLLPAIAFATALPLSAFEKKEIRLDAAPAAVQAAIQNHGAGGKLDEIERITFDGRTIYIAEFDLPGDRDLHVHLSPEGSVLKSVEEIELHELPEPVRQAAQQQAAGAKIDDIHRESANGETRYFIEIDRRGPDLKLTLSASGEVLGQGEEADD